MFKKYPTAHAPASTRSFFEAGFLGETRSVHAASLARRSGPQNCRALGLQEVSQFDVVTGREVFSRTSF